MFERFVPVPGIFGFFPLFRSCGLFVHCCSCSPIPEGLQMGEQMKNSFGGGKEELEFCFDMFSFRVVGVRKLSQLAEGQVYVS